MSKDERKPGELLPILPVEDLVLFPEAEVVLPLAPTAALTAVDAVLTRPELTLVALTCKRPIDPFAPLQAEDLFHVGVKLLLIEAKLSPEDVQAGGARVLVRGGDRVRLMGDFASASPLLIGASCGRFVPVPEPHDFDGEVAALTGEILALVNDLQMHGAPHVSATCSILAASDLDPLDLVYRLAWVLGLPRQQAQALLEAPRRIDALRLMHHYLTSNEAERAQLRDRGDSAVGESWQSPH